VYFTLHTPPKQKILSNSNRIRNNDELSLL
jgi:hypothetical protein